MHAWAMLKYNLKANHNPVHGVLQKIIAMLKYNLKANHNLRGVEFLIK